MRTRKRAKPRVIWMNVSALRPDVFYGLLDAGELPNFGKIFSAGLRARRAVSVFPTVGMTCQASLVTGAMPARHLVAGSAWFDRFGKFPTWRDYNSTVDHLHVYGYKKFGLPTLLLPRNAGHPLGNRDLSGGTQSLYDALRSRSVRSAVVFNPFSRGSHEWIVPTRMDVMQYKSCTAGKASFAGFDRTVARRAIGLINDVERLYRVLHLYFPGCDGLSHWDGPGAQEQYLTRTLDPVFGRILDALSGHTPVDNCHFVLTADHAQASVSPQKTHVVSERGFTEMIEAMGRSRYEPGEHHKAKKKSAVVVLQGGSAHVYLRNEESLRWYDPPRFRDDILETADAFYEFSRRGWNGLEPGWIDLIIVENNAAGCYSVYKNGEVISLKEFFSTPANREKYPDAVRRIAGSRGKRSADLILLANYDQGFHFSSKPFRGQHGNLCREDSLTPLVWAGPGISKGILPGNSSVIDVAPTIATIFDLPLLGSEGRILPIFG